MFTHDRDLESRYGSENGGRKVLDTQYDVMFLVNYFKFSQTVANVAFLSATYHWMFSNFAYIFALVYCTYYKKKRDYYLY